MIYNLKDVVESSKRERFNVISTFAGGGGSSTGYRLAGGKILCINEFVALATFGFSFINLSILLKPSSISSIPPKVSTSLILYSFIIFLKVADCFSLKDNKSLKTISLISPF